MFPLLPLTQTRRRQMVTKRSHLYLCTVRCANFSLVLLRRAHLSI